MLSYAHKHSRKVQMLLVAVFEEGWSSTRLAPALIFHAEDNSSSLPHLLFPKLAAPAGLPQFTAHAPE